MTAGVRRDVCPGAEPFGPGWELRVRGRVVVRVTPLPEGWRVANHVATAARIVPTRGEAEAIADRIARLVASP